MNTQTLKLVLIPFSVGLFGVILTAAFMYFISLDLRLMTLFMSAYYFSTARIVTQVKTNMIVQSVMILCSPVAFLYVILASIPGLYFIIPLIVASAVAGLFFAKGGSGVKKALVFAFLATGLLYSYFKIPFYVQQQLVREVHDPSPDFTFTTLDGTVVNKSDLLGEVVVLDFFGTWCKPCIQELNELAPLTESFPEVKFFVINTDKGGDTIEKVEAFVRKRKLPFEFAYDRMSTMHTSFGFSGVPALVLIDRSGNIRLKHEGYNASENIQSVISRKLNELLNEMN